MRRRIRSAAFPVHRHSLPQLLVDAGLVALAYWLAYRLRFDRGVPSRYDRLFEATILWVVVGSPIVFALFGMYQKWWRYLGSRDLEQVIKGVFVATLALVGAIAVVKPVEISAKAGSVAVGIPTGVVVMYLLLSLALLCGARFLVRTVLERRIRGFHPRHDARDVLIVGAGDGGQLLLREIVRNPELRYRPIGFIDDDPRKKGMRLANGLKVLAPTSELDRVLDETSPEEVIIAIPSAPGTLRARVVTACRDRGIPVRTLPTVFELLLDGGTSVMRQTREVQVEDVLGREPVRMELQKVGAYLTGKTVMVTGAGGSIGGELCRQIARVGPERLVLVDHAEDNLFAIQRELAEERHVTTAVSVLADCREEERMREVFSRHRPAVVFHAAAYKHVGLMERNPIEAVRNNALATRLVAAIAGEMGTEAFVLVSTDKAVTPATVMGASKALAEWSLEASSARFPRTRYAIVRFGNVLGSSGSVVPIFRRQIATGGPVTVTHEEMTRYFMTIPEAVQLILGSGAMSKGGEIFVLDMGEPVKIMDLARQMIRLSGLEPDRDIAIEIIGPRDGEKLHEDLFNPYETQRETAADRIFLAEREPLDPEWVERSFDRINLLVLEGDTAGLAAAVSELSAERSERTVRPAPDRPMQVPH